MVASLVLLGGKGRIYFPIPYHIYFVFRNQKVFKECFFSSLSLLRSFIILFYASEVISHQLKKKKK